MNSVASVSNTITSLQDKSTFDGQQQSASASVMIGLGGGGSLSLGNSKTNSNYQSVAEQSGILAGDGGFQVAVAANTDLKGAVIASTDKAVNDNKNSFTTGGMLSTSDIQNRAEYSASSVSVGVGAGSGGFTPTGVGLGQDSGRAASTTTAGISGIAGNKAVRSTDGQSGIGKIFDADQVQREVNAQASITQAFGQQASRAVADYSTSQRKALQEQLKNAATDTEKAQAQQAIKDVNMQERALNILVGAVTGLGQAAVTRESLSLAAEKMRDLMIEDSKVFNGVVDKDGKPLFSNQSGESAGVNGDGKKVAGTRADLDALCGADNSRCKTNSDGSLALTDKKEVIFVGTKNPDESHQSYADFLQTDEGKKMLSAPFGGLQGGDRTWLFGASYEKGGWVDKLLETFAGPHDLIGGKLSGLYDEQGNATRGRSSTTKNLQEVWSGVAIAPSAPFAAAQFFSPETWKAIGILLKAGQ